MVQKENAQVLICVDDLRPIQQYSHVLTLSCLPGLNQ